ncbi:MarR family transcriptional regulator [Rhodococcus triatomae BKS 15-14]|nr:MarR family transcriptional regulator [Rhodococcus triatomae BKS 15-14]
MERAGHVVRRRDDSDRRKVLLAVTPAAMQLGWSFFGPLLDGATASLDSYTAEELAVVRRFLEDMSRGVAAFEERA